MTVSIEKRNHEYCNDTIELKKEAEEWFLKIGERLYNIRENRYFEAGWSSFEEYEMEFKFSSGTVSKLINVYRKFVLEYEISPAKLVEAGGWTILAEVLPVTNSKKEALEWLEKTTTHSRADIRQDIKESKGALAKEDACKHKNAYTICVCPDCGLRERIANK